MSGNLVERLLGEIGKSTRQVVVVIGDTMTDLWIHGTTAECQDDCRKFVESHRVEVPGGAANAERSISKWGARTACYGFSRCDQPMKTRYVEDGRIVFRSDDEGPASRNERYDWSRELAAEMVRCSGAVLLSDYDKGFLTPKFIADIARMCAKRGVPCVADCKRAPEFYDGCSVLKANGVWAVAHDFVAKNRARIDKYVETHGGDYPGVWDGGVWVPTDVPKMPDVKCVNHVGAGDCFGAHLALALAYGFSLKDAAALAHSAGRVYVQHEHNRPPYPGEIAADMVLVGQRAAISTSTQ